MSETDKLIAFGQWLAAQVQHYENVLTSACADVDKPETLIRLKYGNLEAFRECMIAFTELYNEPLENWRKDRLGIEKENEDAEDNESGSE